MKRSSARPHYAVCAINAATGVAGMFAPESVCVCMEGSAEALLPGRCSLQNVAVQLA